MKYRIIYYLPNQLRNWLFSIYGFFQLQRRKRYLVKYIQEMKDYYSMDNNEKSSFVKNRLELLLSYCRNNVPYYRKYWDEKLECEPSKDFLVLSNWPVLSKSDIRKNPLDFVADGFAKKKLIKISTSGTTGTPMQFYFDNESYSQWYAYYYYNTIYKDGFTLSTPWGNLGGRLVVNVNRVRPPFWIWNGPMKQLYLSSYHLTRVNIKSYVRAIENYKLEYLVGYPSSLFALSQGIVELALTINCVKVIYTNAEPLLEHQRLMIQNAFDCKVVQTYGSSEFALAASDDDKEGMSVWPLTGIIETASKNEGLAEEFLITGLVNRAMPLIRYEIGDVGSILVTETGTSKTIIKEIVGRTDDIIISPSGKLIGRLDPIFKNDINIKEAQIVQLDLDNILIKIVQEENFTSIDYQCLMRMAKERLGEEFNVEIRAVDRIDRGSNGKFKAVISLISHE